jgi:FAD/FMN-containing dehydrogenase
VLTDADLRAGYEVDWTRRYSGEARCVVRPSSVDEVAAVVRACAASGAAIVAQGGNTGLVGGSVPRGGEVVVSLRRLTRLDPVDMAAGQVTVGAGVTIEALQQHARAAGLDFAVDWGARGSATVGGAVATNAGGSRVVRFGTMRSQVMGIEAVLADGAVLSDLRGLPKETLGPHLPTLLTGSEGSLAIITAARLRLVPLYTHHATAVIVLGSLVDAPRLLARLRTLSSLDAVELILPAAAALTESTFRLGLPLSVPPGGAAVLVDCAADHDPLDELTAAVGDFDGVVADGAQRIHLFELRDHISMAINAAGVPLKLDVAVPVELLDEVVTITDDAIHTHAPDATLYAFGHLAEGNLHLNIVGAGSGADAIRDDVLDRVVAMGGTISAEHGVGIAKTAWLDRVKGPAGAGALRAIKHALDPDHILNPGVLFSRD